MREDSKFQVQFPLPPTLPGKLYRRGCVSKKILVNLANVSYDSSTEHVRRVSAPTGSKILIHSKPNEPMNLNRKKSNENMATKVRQKKSQQELLPNGIKISKRNESKSFSGHTSNSNKNYELISSPVLGTVTQTSTPGVGC